MSRQRRHWARPELYLLHRLFPCTQTEILAARLGRSYGAVSNQAHLMGIYKSKEFRKALNTRLGQALGRSRASVETRFQKGIVPHNAGVKHRPGWAPGRMREGQFKRGEHPPTWVPIGSYRVNCDGYCEKKVADHGPGLVHKNWMGVHRLVWIENHGPIPPGHVVVFKEGQRTSELEQITIDRLEIINRVELMRRNSYHTRYPKEIGQLIQLRGALTRQINKRERDAQQDK